LEYRQKILLIFSQNKAKSTIDQVAELTLIHGDSLPFYLPGKRAIVIHPQIYHVGTVSLPSSSVAAQPALNGQ
jgi:hypothetical protein